SSQEAVRVTHRVTDQYRLCSPWITTKLRYQRLTVEFESFAECHALLSVKKCNLTPSPCRGSTPRWRRAGRSHFIQINPVFGGLFKIFIPKLRPPAVSRALSGPSRFWCGAHSKNKESQCTELFFHHNGVRMALKRDYGVYAG